MSLDVVIPAHNEEHRIGRTLTDYRAALSDASTTFLVAMDDCTDGTAAIVAEHAAADPRVVAFDFPRLGKGGVLLEAFRRSSSDLVAFVDADKATPPPELRRLVDVVQSDGVDIAMCSRWHPAAIAPVPRSRLRRLSSVLFARAVRRLFDLSYYDTQCGAKVLRREAAARVVPLVASRDFVFDVDLLVVARDLGLRVAEVPSLWIDQEGSSVDVRRDSVQMGVSLLRLWLHHRVMPVMRPAREQDGRAREGRSGTPGEGDGA